MTVYGHFGSENRHGPTECPLGPCRSSANGGANKDLSVSPGRRASHLPLSASSIAVLSLPPRAAGKSYLSTIFHHLGFHGAAYTALPRLLPTLAARRLAKAEPDRCRRSRVYVDNTRLCQ